MRVERFALFFPPLIFKVRRGETEYGIGCIPLGGYVRITGMNPREELAPEVLPRAYYLQKPWKRIVVILAGPMMNVLIAFLILLGLYLSQGNPVGTDRVDSTLRGSAAAAVLRPGDRLLAVDGVRGSVTALRNQIGTHTCAGRQVQGCRATVPAKLTVRRGSQTLQISVRPRYDRANKRALLGFTFGFRYAPIGVGGAAKNSVTDMWRVTKGTVSAITRLFYSSAARKQVNGVVGSYAATRAAVNTSAVDALNILAIISLSLAIVNLFPFLPLDGGHVFWALAEKVRGRRIPFSVMERAGMVGFLLIIFLFIVGLTNDINTLRGKGFGAP